MIDFELIELLEDARLFYTRLGAKYEKSAMDDRQHASAKATDKLAIASDLAKQAARYAAAIDRLRQEVTT